MNIGGWRGASSGGRDGCAADGLGGGGSLISALPIGYTARRESFVGSKVLSGLDGNVAAKVAGGQSSLRRRTLGMVAVAGVSYAAWCGTMYFYQDKLLFPADMAPPPLPLGYHGLSTVEMKLGLAGGGSVVAWFLPAPKATPSSPAPVVAYFHGNAEIIDYQHEIVEGYHRLGCSILLPEYRGYGRAGGKPSEGAIVADAACFYDELVKRPDVDASRIVFHGRSLGGGPAAQLAARRTPRALILESAFSSVAAMASKYGCPSFLAKNPFHTDHVLESLDVPVLIFHGTNDDIIPVSHGRRLRDLARHGTYVEYGCRHNDFPGGGNEEAYWNEIAAFLRRSGVIEAAIP
jgi:fermentation-respiration switch protein FrsA (DUF1100 family)